MKSYIKQFKTGMVSLDPCNTDTSLRLKPTSSLYKVIFVRDASKDGMIYINASTVPLPFKGTYGQIRFIHNRYLIKGMGVSQSKDVMGESDIIVFTRPNRNIFRKKAEKREIADYITKYGKSKDECFIRVREAGDWKDWPFGSKVETMELMKALLWPFDKQVSYCVKDIPLLEGDEEFVKCTPQVAIMNVPKEAITISFGKEDDNNG